MNPTLLLLSVNGPKGLIELSISSILRHSTVNVLVAHLDDSEIEKFPSDERISFFKLTPQKVSQFSASQSSYRSFQDDEFFRLVEYKWELFEFALDALVSEYFVYLDLDVVLLGDAIFTVGEIFRNAPNADAIVQDATVDPNEPLLCMGVFAFRNSQKSKDLVKVTREQHKKMNLSLGRFGDDDAITSVYQTQRNAFDIVRLPQQAFPVGSLASLWSPFTIVRGLRPKLPLVFHANYVTSVRRKCLLLKYFLESSEKGRVSVSAWIRVWLRQLLRLW